MNLNKLMARCCNSFLQKVQGILKSPTKLHGKGSSSGTKFSCSIPPAQGTERQRTPCYQSNKKAKQLNLSSGLATLKCRARS